MLFSRGSSQPRYWTHVSLSPASAGRFFPISATWEALSAGSCYLFPVLWVEGFPCGSAGKESTCTVEDLGSIPGLGRSLEEGKGYPFNYLTSIIRIIKCLSGSFFVSFQQLESSHFAFFSRACPVTYQPSLPATFPRWSSARILLLVLPL